MRPLSLVYEDIARVNKSKQQIIIQYCAAQDNPLNSAQQKIKNCQKIYYELRKKNDELTELECEVVSSIAYAI